MSRPVQRPVPDGVQRPVPDGVADYRRRIRRSGAFLGLVLPACMLIVAIAIFAIVPCSGRSCVVRHGPGWGLGALAAPTGILVGMPWNRGPIVVAGALVSSVALWSMLGWFAGRRAAGRAVADWSEWRREFAWVVVPMWIGTSAAAIGLAVIVAVR